MSYASVTRSQYQNIPAGVPGWQLAPVPGWGINPELAGPRVIATNGAPGGCGCASPDGLGANDSESQANEGYIAAGIAGGLFLGWFLSWFYFTQVKKTSR